MPYDDGDIDPAAVDADALGRHMGDVMRGDWDAPDMDLYDQPATADVP